jgi:hypothetical protein
MSRFNGLKTIETMIRLEISMSWNSYHDSPFRATTFVIKEGFSREEILQNVRSEFGHNNGFQIDNVIG